MSLKFSLVGSPSMSLKFTAMGRLPILSALETAARADDQAQTLGPASNTPGPPRRQARYVVLLPAGLGIFGIAASIAFLIMNV